MKIIRPRLYFGAVALILIGVYFKSDSYQAADFVLAFIANAIENG